ncbi:MAG: hypothetical protein ISS55_05130 [Dehalococcoidales bacterium]|nr:hypothetical protein [Dehalococcoidales bacterium]
MSIAIVCNLSDGVVLGADSAITVTANQPGVEGAGPLVAKVYNEAEKVFPLADLPMGIVNFGVAMIRSRTIGSFVDEFVATSIEKDPPRFAEMDVAGVAKELGIFFFKEYEDAFKQILKQRKDQGGAQRTGLPILGLVVAGYSPGAYLAEVLDASMPGTIPDKDPLRVREQGNFGSNWFGNFAPLHRLIKGVDQSLINRVIDYFVKEREVSFGDDDKKKIEAIVRSFEGQIPYAAMPLNEGVAHVRFLLDTVIGNTKWVLGPPTCGGVTRIGVVRRKGPLRYVTDSSVGSVKRSDAQEGIA